MPAHSLARLAGCFATGALAAAGALIGLDQAAPLAFPLKLAWFRLGGNGAVARGFALHSRPISPQPAGRKPVANRPLKRPQSARTAS